MVDNPALREPLVVIQHFGVNPASYVRFKLPGHDGVDCPADFGQQVYAPVDAVIAVTGWDADGWGLYLALDATDRPERFILAHLSTYQASKEGDHVIAGTPIALAGSTGNSTAPHLHVGWLPDRDYEGGPYRGRCDPVPRIYELARGAP